MLVAAVIVIAVAGCGGGDPAGTATASNATGHSSNIQAQKQRVKKPLRGLPPLRHPRGTPPGTLGSRLPGTFPAEILPGASDYFSTDIIYPQTNFWHASNHRKITVVQAGSQAYHKDNGIFGIYRENYVRDKRGGDFVKVVGTGPVTITKAPEGTGKVQTWSQNHGKLRFKSKSGITGALDLSTDTVTLNP